jgi:hypothetical protein
MDEEDEENVEETPLFECKEIPELQIEGELSMSLFELKVINYLLHSYPGGVVCYQAVKAKVSRE